MNYDVLLKEINGVLKDKNAKISLLEYQVRDLRDKIERLEKKNEAVRTDDLSMRGE